MRTERPRPADRPRARTIPLGGAGYPAALAQISDPPAHIHVLGALDERPAVAIVGSRACSAYGSRVASRLAGDLARRGLVVISGMARGIDAAAHRGALQAGGTTVAVLPGGLDPVYPRRHRGLARAIAASGALVAEHEPGTPVGRWHFPQRNRIIAGLALVVVVVEAAARSGARITADLALGYGREVMVVPGPVTSATSVGCHALLAQGAHPCTSADDVIAQLPPMIARAAVQQRPPVEIDRQARRLLALLTTRGEIAIEAAARELACPLPRILVACALLEAHGLARRGGSNRIEAC